MHDQAQDLGAPLESPLIYAVDDEPMLLQLTAAILEPQGYVVAGYRSGEVALKDYIAAGDHRPSLVITDYAMGPAGFMNGLELIEQCRRIDPRQKTILLSGTIEASDCQDAAAKPDEFLPKPYHPPQLVKAVRGLLGN